MSAFCHSSIPPFQSTPLAEKFNPRPSAQHSAGSRSKGTSATVSLKLNICSFSPITAGHILREAGVLPRVRASQSPRAAGTRATPCFTPRHVDSTLKVLGSFSHCTSGLAPPCPRPEQGFTLPLCTHWHPCSQQTREKVKRQRAFCASAGRVNWAHKPAHRGSTEHRQDADSCLRRVRTSCLAPSQQEEN